MGAAANSAWAFSVMNGGVIINKLRDSGEKHDHGESPWTGEGKYKGLSVQKKTSGNVLRQ